VNQTRALSGLLFLGFVGACAQPSIGVSSEPIIRGERETGYPEVVAVYWTDGASAGGLCSGTVIGPHAVLTAKHCVFDETASGHTAVPSGWFYVIEGDDIEAATAVHRVSEVRTTPGTDIDSDVSNGSDIAILLLPDTLTMTPRGYATSGPSEGASAIAVGFGRTIAGTPMSSDSGVKYSGTMSIRRVFSYLVSADGASWTCQGDSGGPLIDSAGNVTGITSFGFDSTCFDNLSVFTRVAAWTSLISDALAWAPPCVPAHEICNALDDDCNGIIDDGLGCAPLGTACATDEECVTARCEDVNGAMICTRSCFPDFPIDPCEPVTGFHCEVLDCGTGRCAPGAPGAGAAGAECAADTDCASGYCADLQGRRLCGAQCQPGISDCGGGELCNLETGTECGACVPEALAMGPRPFGSACTTDVQCASEACRPPGFCTQDCTSSDDCPGAYHCDGLMCAPGELARQGGACSVDGDCRESAPDCVEGACAATCTLGGAECPPDYVCADVDGPHCVRDGTALGDACTTNEECRSGICAGTCTILCDSTLCPEGYECRNAGPNDACFPLGGGGSAGGCACSAARGSASGAMFASLGLALALTVRRRRTR
jgi:MYXO-CTERM domain-containing protein